MSVATEKVKFATERFLLVRLNPARFILPVSIGGGVYETEFPYIPNKLERNGTALTKVSAPPTNNDEWSYEDSTATLQVKLATAPDSTENILIAYYYLFYTGTVYKTFYEDPDDDTSPLREWVPKISSYPSFLQSVSNILAGIFTISDTTLNLINEDGSFQDYLTDDDSFYNKSVEIWLGITSTDNLQKVFSGTMQELSLTSNTVTIRCKDAFNSLNQAALFGDEPNEAYFRRNSLSFPDLDPAFQDSPCPYIVGSSSRYKTNFIFVNVLPEVVIAYTLNTGNQAFCTSFNQEISAPTNRTWGLCRMAGGLQTQSFGAVEAVVGGGAFIFVRFASLSNVFIGDTIEWVEAATTYYGLINYVGNFTYAGDTYNLIISDPDTPFTLASVVNPTKSVGIIITTNEQEVVYPRYGRDYTVIETPTSGGNNYLSLEFEINFEANHPAMGADFLNPQTHTVRYRVSNTVVQTHADIIEEMLTRSGLAINAASFAAANTALDVNCRFSVPYFDESDFDLYLKYCQDVLASAIGYLKVNSDFEVEYHLIEAPSSTDIRDSSLTLGASTSCDVEYADIVTTIIAYNPHNDSQVVIDSATTPSETRQSLKAQYLHGVVNVDRFRHVLEEISSRIDAHIGLKSSRRGRYNFETATQDIETEIGDDLQIENKIVLGGSEMADVKVISIDKSPARIRIEASDLKGI